MPEEIKVLIVDDITATRENICKLLAFEPAIVVIGQAASGVEAVQKVKILRPDVILMDINMPAMDGITAAEQVLAENPYACIIMMSVQGEPEYKQQAMAAGAQDYLIKPFSTDELLQAVKRGFAHAGRQRTLACSPAEQAEPGKIITVFSTKGGIGKTTIAVNLAVALAEQTDSPVGIVDANLQFGDAALFLNLSPQCTIVDLVRDSRKPDGFVLEKYLSRFNRNIWLLPAPLRPEQAETITASHLAAVFTAMRAKFKYTIIDTAPAFSENMLAALDAADIVLVVAAMDLPTIKNVKLCLESMASLGYDQDKVKVILNRANTTEPGITIDEIEAGMWYKFAATIPSDGKVVVTSVNRGLPFIVSHPETPVAQSLFDLAHMVAGSGWQEQEQEISLLGITELLKRLFS